MTKKAFPYNVPAVGETGVVKFQTTVPTKATQASEGLHARSTGWMLHPEYIERAHVTEQTSTREGGEPASRALTYVGLCHDVRQPVGGPAAPALRGGGGGGGRGGAVDGLADPVLHVDAALAGGGGSLGIALHRAFVFRARRGICVEQETWLPSAAAQKPLTLTPLPTLPAPPHLTQ